MSSLARQRVWAAAMLLGFAAGASLVQAQQQTAPTPDSASAVVPQVQAPAAAPAQSAVPVPQSAQPVKNPDGTYTIRNSARLVVLDVVVTDRQGNVVSGLTRDQFRVTEAGDPETLLHFEQAGVDALAPSTTINSTADLDRLAPSAPVNIILLDEFNTRFEDMAFARTH